MLIRPFVPSWNWTSRNGARHDAGSRQVDAIHRRLGRQLKAAQVRKRRSDRLKVPAASSDHRTSSTGKCGISRLLRKKESTDVRIFVAQTNADASW